MKRVVVLIDGQNLYYGLRNLNILEKDIKWSDFFKWLLNSEDELIRTYWFRPQRILDTYFTSQNIKNQIVYKKYNKHYNDFKNNPSTIEQSVVQKIEKEASVIENWLKNEKIKFSQIEYNYDQLSLEFEDIEIVKTGIVKVNPYLQEFVGEKGVDIALAVKMISLSVEKKCDKIILISGDYDYAEAIKFRTPDLVKQNQ